MNTAAEELLGLGQNPRLRQLRAPQGRRNIEAVVWRCRALAILFPDHAIAVVLDAVGLLHLGLPEGEQGFFVP